MRQKINNQVRQIRYKLTKDIAAVMFRKTSIRIFLFFVVLVFFGEVCVYGANDFGLTTRLALVANQSDEVSARDKRNFVRTS